VSEGLVSDEALDPAAVARSRAELALFRALEEATQTRGAFHLNARQPWLFGDREVEIDLYAPRWRLAIELDGYYHFREPDNFRRDRRKDLEYQLHDIVVFRVLAEDVEEDVSNTVSRIVRLIERLEIQPT
jgi:very-short-patch-repair endonuclease